MGIAFNVGTAKGTTGAPGRTGNGDLTITLPSGWNVGDLGIIILYSDQGSGSVPANWNEISGSPFGSGTEKLQIFWKFLESGESDPITTISGSGTNISHCANVACYSGVDTNNPISVIGTASNGTGSPMTAGAITTTSANQVVIGCCGRGDNENASGQTFDGSATGVVEILDGGTSEGNDSQVSAYDKLIPTSGASSGNGSAATSVTDPWVSVLIALKEMPAPTANIIKDSFNRANSSNLNASSSGKELDGSAADFQHTEIANDCEIVSNQVTNTNSNNALVRAEVNLNSADHYAQIDVVSIDTANNAGVECNLRFSPTANTRYMCEYFYSTTAGGYRIAFQKVVDGSSGGRIAEIADSSSFPFTMKCTAITNGSDVELKVYINGELKNSTTDNASVLTDVMTGFTTRQAVVDNYEAGIVVDNNIEGSVQGTSLLTAVLTAIGILAGSITASSAVIGNLTQEGEFGGSVNAISSLSGTLTGKGNISSNVSSSSGLTADLKGSIKITGIQFNFSSIIDNLAVGSDNWVITWSDDNHQYTSWGDGGGFSGDNNNGRVSMGIARIEGTKDSRTYVDVNGGLTPESGNTTWPETPGNGGKCYGIISIDGVLWLWRTGTDSGNSAHLIQDLWKSTDKGYTWTKQTGVEWTKASDFGDVYPVLYAFTFCQFGQDNSEAVDNYVYTYMMEAEDADWGISNPGKIYLMRVLKTGMSTKSNYRYFAGLNGNDEPIWSANLGDRVPVWQSNDGLMLASVFYNPVLRRYILTAQQVGQLQTENGHIGIFESPTPYGPWTRIYFENAWTVGLADGSWTVFWNFSPKWLSGDGKDFVLVGTLRGSDEFGSIEGEFLIEEPGLSGAINGTSTLTGTLTAKGNIAADIITVSDLSLTLTGKANISSSVSSSSGLTGMLSAKGVLAAASAAASDLTGTLTGKGNISGSSDAISFLQLQYVPEGLSGSVGASSNLSAALTGRGSLSSGVSASSSVNGSLSGKGNTSSSVSSSSSLNASINAKGNISAGISSVSFLQLEYIPEGTFGSVDAASGLSATLTGKGNVSSSVSGSSTISGELKATGNISAETNSVSLLTGDLTEVPGNDQIAGSVSSGSGLSLSLSGKGSLSSSVSSSSGLNADLKATANISGGINSISFIVCNYVLPIGAELILESEVLTELTLKSEVSTELILKSRVT